VTKRCSRRSRAAHCASTIWLAEYDDEPDHPHLSLVHQVGEGSERLFDVGIGGGTVHLVEVDVVGLQSPQGTLDLAHDPLP
jgi:hypothetical protein